VKRIALYARVSTKQHGQDPETQLVALRQFASHKGYIICEEYVDHGWSGAKERRPALDRLLADARNKKFDVVLVWRFDRFARSVKQLIFALGLFRELGIDFISQSEQIDTTTPVGRMVFTIMAAVGEMVREIIRENVQIGVDRARADGKKLGRPTVLVDKQRVYDLVEAKVPIAAIAREFGIARSTVRAKHAAVAAEKADAQGGESLIFAAG
jgi:DNA invertase Pin-like site-specific DNA recombinase